ncbi:pyruvate formate lyase activating enzyme [Dysgonomonadaceae bacterium PH5-43]|nr:pyruvate formate lyase activating enzyme [Dysgonomonadaceae bacterium PH5-43]
MKGKIHSLESFGTVDGPGLRFVVFMQGCPLRCLYCHNPDTWDTTNTAKIELTPQELLEEILKYKSFIAKGGVTLTGGEPLLQAEFVTEFFKLCKQKGIHTALDTSGAVFNDKAKEALKYTDLVLLDIKAISPELHKTITGVKIDNTLRFLDYLEEQDKDTWIRHVIVPGYTDNDKQLETLAEYISNYKIVKKVELLPYHTMGVNKYEQLGLKYKLEGVEPLSAERLNEIKKIFAK